MKQLRLLSLAAVLAVLPIGALSQSSQGQADAKQQPVGQAQHDPANHPLAGDEHFKMLSEKLNLSSDQAAKVRPLLKEMDDGVRKVREDQGMSPTERTDRIRSLQLKADKKIRSILNDEQKRTLDQMEQEAHLNLHGMM